MSNYILLFYMYEITYSYHNPGGGLANICWLKDARSLNVINQINNKIQNA